jgi:hypothetical protein
LCETNRELSAVKFRALVKILMCDACRILGAPWLPELHAGQSRPRVRTVLRLRVKTAAKPRKKK